MPVAEMQRAALADGPKLQKEVGSTREFTPEPIDFQALKLSGLYSFQQATAYTIAQLVWGAG